MTQKKGPLTADQNDFMLPPEMPVDETINNRSAPNDEGWITMPYTAGSGRYPLAPALECNRDKLLLFHKKKFRSIYLQGASGQPKGNGIKSGKAGKNGWPNLAIAMAIHFYLCRSLLAGGCIGQPANLCCLFFFSFIKR